MKARSAISVQFLTPIIVFLFLHLNWTTSENVIDADLEESDPSVTEVTDLNLTFRGDFHRAVVHTHNKVVVCYVGTWAAYRQPEEGAFDIEGIEPLLCTHLIYSFAGLDNSTFRIKPLDPWLDQRLQENGGGRDWYKKFNDLKMRHPHLKVLLAIGGWNEGSKSYSDMAGNAMHRTSFISSAVELIRKYGFDGLDLDWEFPGQRGGVVGDKRSFTVLVQELRAKFDQFGLLLTSAFGPAKSTAEQGYELREVSRHLDHVHLMAYDYHGTWDKKTGHNAPMHDPAGNGSIEESVNFFLNEGVPPEKLVLGFPFYGRTFLLQEKPLGDGQEEGPRVRAGLGVPAMDKGFEGPFTKEAGFLGFNEICRELKSSRGSWTTYWDKVAKVPYMRNGNKWVSFENPDSIREKIKFLAEKNLRGAMIWSIDTDDFKGACGVRNPLLRTINFALLQNTGSRSSTSRTTRRPSRPTAAGAGINAPSFCALVNAIGIAAVIIQRRLVSSVV